MEEFFIKLQQTIKTWKPYLVAIIAGLAIVQLFVSSAVGGQDRRQTIVNIFGLIAFAAFIMYSDSFFDWLIQTFGK